jgi:hypothetical protein
MSIWCLDREPARAPATPRLDPRPEGRNFNPILHLIAFESAQGHLQIERIVLDYQNRYFFMVYCCHYFSFPRENWPFVAPLT